MEAIINLERVVKFGNPDETLVEFAQRCIDEAMTGSKVAWTVNAANVGTLKH